MSEEILNKLGLHAHPYSCYLSYAPEYATAPLSCEIIYVRHGETFGNRYRLFQGFADVSSQDGTGLNDLTDLGSKQAAAVGRELLEKHAGWMPDAVLASPLVRARKTAKLILDTMQCPLDPVYIDDLREIKFGEWENKTLADMPPEQRRTARRYLMSDACAKAPSGESFIDLLQRAQRVLTYLHTQYQNKRVLVVAHGTVGNAIRLLRRQLIVHQDGFIRWHGEENFIPNAQPLKIS